MKKSFFIAAILALSACKGKEAAPATAAAPPPNGPVVSSTPLQNPTPSNTMPPNSGFGVAPDPANPNAADADANDDSPSAPTDAENSSPIRHPIRKKAWN